MTYAQIKAWLQQTIGLDAVTAGPLAVERAVDARMAACAVGDLSAYDAYLQGSTAEQQALIERLVVRETYFFRDAPAFDALTDLFGAEWQRTHPETLRLLSVPCASGEESFSMAMALLDAGFPAARLRIDAMDISRTALDAAERGLFGSHSFRGRNLAFRTRHFQQAGPRWQVSAAVREPVRFRWGNVLTLGTDDAPADYHAIYCRNLLIYFDEAAQLATVSALCRLLRDDGLLFVGPSESGLLLAMGFTPAQMPMAFAFRKPGADRARKTLRVAEMGEVPLARPVAMEPARAAPAVLPFRRVTPVAQAPVATRTAGGTPLVLAAAERLADTGRYEEAAAIIDAHVQAHGPSARALFLQGLVHGARADTAGAEACFRKALYLQPDHAQSLAHLALLLDARGDDAGAQRLRHRARRTGSGS